MILRASHKHLIITPAGCRSNCSAQVFGEGDAGGSALRLNKLIRLLRMVKLLRLFRLYRLSQGSEVAHFIDSFSPSTMRLMAVFVVMITWFHVLACICSCRLEKEHASVLSHVVFVKLMKVHERVLANVTASSTVAKVCTCACVCA